MTHVDSVSGRAGRGWFFFRIRGRSDRVTTAGEQLDAQGVHIPLVADMHFNRKAAMIACEAYDKIRVNPGNFADGRKTFEEIDYDVTGGVLGTRRRRVWFDAIDAFPSRGGRRRSESHASRGRYQHRTRSSSKMKGPTSRKRLHP